MGSDNNFVSWSKNGIIMYAKDTAVALTFFESINGTNWRLHPEKYYSIGTYEMKPASGKEGDKTNSGVSLSGNTPSKINFNIERIHFSNWASLSGDLVAVFDEIGTLSILMVGINSSGVSTLDQVALIFQDSILKIPSQKEQSIIKNLKLLKSVDEIEKNSNTGLYSTSVVAFEWICSSKQVMTSKLTSMDGHGSPGSGPAVSKLSFNSLPPFGVFHPQFIKYSCVCIRHNGEVNLWYQFSNSKETKKLTLQITETDWLDTAEIAHSSENNVFFVTTYSKALNEISVYKLSIDWKAQQQQQQPQQGQSPQATVLEDPSLQCEKVLEFAPAVLHDNELVKLSKCKMISRSYDLSGQAELLLFYEIAGQKKTVIKRHQIQQVAPIALFTNFFLQKEATNFEATKSYQLKLMDTFIIDDVVEDVQYQYIQDIFHIRLSNGSSRFYKKSNWTELIYKEKLVSDQVSPLETGFEFPVLPKNLEWCTLSPLACGLLYKINRDSVLHYTPYITKSLTITENKIISLAYNFVSCTHKSCMGEDATIAIQTYLMSLNDIDRREQIILAIIQTCFNFFGFLPNSAREVVERIIITKPMQKLMLLQLELSGVFEKSSRVYLMSRSIMCFRDILFAFNTVARNAQMMIQHSATMSAQNNGGKLYQFSFSKQDLIFSLLPISKWFVKYVAFLAQELVSLINNSTGEDNLFALSVIGGKVTRVLLLAILQEINKIKQLLVKFPETAYPALNDSSLFLLKVFEESPVNFEKFEKFLIDINNKLQANDDKLLENSSTSSTSHELSSREAYILMKGTIPKKFSYFKDIILDEFINTLIPEMDVAHLYFSDTSGLKLFAEEFYTAKFFKLLQPISKGLIIEDKEIRLEKSINFSNMDCDDVTKESLDYKFDAKNVESNSELKYKRCVRCGNVTMAGYVIPKSKTVVATSISTRRWCSVYAKNCTCSGMLHEIS